MDDDASRRDRPGRPSKAGQDPLLATSRVITSWACRSKGGGQDARPPRKPPNSLAPSASQPGVLACRLMRAKTSKSSNQHAALEWTGAPDAPMVPTRCDQRHARPGGQGFCCPSTPSPVPQGQRGRAIGSPDGRLKLISWHKICHDAMHVGGLWVASLFACVGSAPTARTPTTQTLNSRV